MNIRPETLDQFVGQEQARRILHVLIAAARKRGEPVPHLLMSGPPGLGKTSLARVLANEMNGNLIEMVGSAVKNPADINHHLLQLKPNDVLFLDEIHAVPRKAEEALYPAMEDGLITTTEHGFDDMMKQLGIRSGQQSTKSHRLPPFTLIGATTLLGLCTAPLRSRFRQILELQPYKIAELTQILTSAGARIGFAIPENVAHGIAQRSRGTARTAINHLMWYRDVVQGDGGVPTLELVEQAFTLKGVDVHGMTHADREYLRHLLESDEPVGLGTLASALGESVETLQESVEPFMLRAGFIQRTPRGRVATERARNVFQEVARVPQ